MGRDEGRAASLPRGLSGVGPVEGMTHRRIVIGDELSDLILQILHRSEVSTTENFAVENPKNDLDLVEPRTVLG